MERRGYSNCPLKKRPIYVTNEVNVENDALPVDLSRRRSRTEKCSTEDVTSEPTEQFLSKDVKDERYACKQLSSDPQFTSTVYYGKELRTSANTHTELPQSIRNTNPDALVLRGNQREDSASPPVLQVNYPPHYSETYKNPSKNYNNNDLCYQNQYQFDRSDHLMLSPTSSHFSYGSGQSDVGDYSEPEDLSVKYRKEVLILRGSGANNSGKPESVVNNIERNDLYYKCRSSDKCYSSYPDNIRHGQSHNSLGDMNLYKAEYKTISLGESDLIVKEKIPAKVSDCSKYKCSDCDKTYSTFSGLTKHQQFHCPSIKSNQVKKLFSCKNCEKVYVSLGALKMHIRTHTLPCKCPLCGKAFSRPWLLQGHIRTHTGEKPFVCQHCNRAFADRSNLRAHLQTHSNIKKYSCSSCTKTFSRMSLLGKHLQSNCSGTLPNYQRCIDKYSEQGDCDRSNEITEFYCHQVTLEENDEMAQDYSLKSSYGPDSEVY